MNKDSLREYKIKDQNNKTEMIRKYRIEYSISKKSMGLEISIPKVKAKLFLEKIS